MTGKIDENTKFDPTDFRNNVPRFSPQARKANMALVDVVKVVATRKNVTPAQVALAWLSESGRYTSAFGRCCDWRGSISTSVMECDCMPT